MKKILLILIVLSSCSPVYVPNSRNTPMFTKGGEFQGTFSAGNGFEAQTALSLTNHIGVIGNYSYINNTNEDNTKDYHRHKFFEGGIGYFENQEKMFFEVFAGYGKGEGASYDNFGALFGGTEIQATGKYHRYFIQPAFGFNKKVMQISFVPRVAIVDFTEFSNGTTTFTDNEDPVFFFEPAVVGRVNFADNHMFFTFQGGFSASMNSNRNFDNRPLQFSTGLGFRLGGKRSGE